MKKFLSLALTLCLLVCSLSAAMIQPAVAESTADSYFETASNWHRDVEDDVFGAGVKGTNAATINRDATFVNDGATSLKIDANSWVMGIALPDLKVGKSYKFSFKYYVPTTTTCSSLAGWLNRVGVYKNSSFTVETKGKIPDGTTAIAGGTSTKLVGAGSLTSGSTGDATWYPATFVFTVTEETGTDLHFAFWNWFSSSNNDVLYLDDFSLEELDYYSNAANWGAVAAGATIGGNVNAVAITNDTTTVYEEPNVKFAANMHGVAPTIQLQNVKAGKTYEVSFNHYHYDATLLVDSTKYGLFDIGIYKAGTVKGATSSVAADASYKVAACSVASSDIYAVQTWNKYVATFTIPADADVTALYFAFALWRTKGIYISNFQIKEVSTYEIASNWKAYAKGETLGGTAATTGKVGQITATSGTVTTTTEGLVSGAIALKISNAHGMAAATKLTDLIPGADYTFRFKYYAPSDAQISGANQWFFNAGIYQKGTTIGANGVPNSENKVALLEPSNKNSQNQTWYDYSISFNAGSNTELYFACRLWAAGIQSICFDEICLELNGTDHALLQTSYNSKAAIRAASNTDGSIASNGLRTYNAIKSDWVDAADSSIVEFGSIAIREGYMEKKFPTKSAPDLDMLSLVGKGVGIGVSYRSAATVTGSDTITSTLWENNNTDGVFATDIFTAYLTGIDAANYGEEYLVRAYAIDASGNIYYGDTASVSIFKVAQAISEENLGVPIDNAAFDAFVGSNQEAYEAWCTNNQKAVGDYYTANYAN